MSTALLARPMDEKKVYIYDHKPGLRSFLTYVYFEKCMQFLFYAKNICNAQKEILSCRVANLNACNENHL